MPTEDHSSSSRRKHSSSSSHRRKYQERSDDIKRESSRDYKKVKIEDGDDKKIKDELHVKELMTQAQRSIEERKKLLKLPTTPSQSGLNIAMLQSAKLAPAEAEKFMALSLEKVNRIAELKNRVANSIANKPTALLVDNKGRICDVHGNEIQVSKQVPTLKANIRDQKRELIRRAQVEAEKPSTTTEGDQPDTPSYVDPRVSQRGFARQRRQFKFHEKGEFETLANKQRAKAKLEKLQAEISQAAKNTGISSAVKLAMVAPQSDTSERQIPIVEWWDSVVLEGNDYESFPDAADSETIDVRYGKTISHLVEHPIQLKPPDEPSQPHYLKVYLTKKERKKIRRQNRKEMQKEQTEKIRLGLEPPPEPKMKISNLMRVLGSDAIQDPTKMEAHVRKQMAERIRKHEEANAQRKLTKEQRCAKQIKKMHEDVTMGVHVAVYRIKSLAHPARKFKTEMNAKQLQMTGIILMHKDINIVVVEGGPKQQRFYKRLMLTRMKWEDEIIGQKKDADKDAEGERNKCDLVWEGIAKKRNFGEIRCKTVALEKQARELLEKHSVAHYWDMAYSGAVLLQDSQSDNII